MATTAEARVEGAADEGQYAASMPMDTEGDACSEAGDSTPPSEETSYPDDNPDDGEEDDEDPSALVHIANADAVFQSRCHPPRSNHSVTDDPDLYVGVPPPRVRA